MPRLQGTWDGVVRRVGIGINSDAGFGQSFLQPVYDLDKLPSPAGGRGEFVQIVNRF